MINNFVCWICKKYKSQGKPLKNGKWVCLDCYYKKRGDYGRYR